MTAQSPFAAFPSFRPMFEPPADEGAAPYLAFLHPRPDTPYFAEAARLSLGCIRSSGSVLDAELAGLLGAGWRTQLVAATAMLQAGPSAPRASLLWGALDAERPSWVSPQLAAAARVIDPDFVAHAWVRLERAGTPDPAASPWRKDTKLMGALVGLLRALDVSWLPSVLADPEIAALVARDAQEDDGAGIASAWADAMQAISTAAN